MIFLEIYNCFLCLQDYLAGHNNANGNFTNEIQCTITHNKQS